MSKRRYRSAAALAYSEKSDSAPTLIAAGREQLADEVVRLAKRFGVPVVERPELARTLSVLDVDQEIPEKLFQAVALVLCELDKD